MGKIDYTLKINVEEISLYSYWNIDYHFIIIIIIIIIIITLTMKINGKSQRFERASVIIKWIVKLNSNYSYLV